MVGLEGGGDDAVLAGDELVSAADLSQVDEGRGLGHRGVVFKEPHVQRSIARIFQLVGKNKTGKIIYGNLGWLLQ